MKKKVHTPLYRLVITAICGLVVTACAMGAARQFTAEMLDSMPHLPRIAAVENVPFFAQEDKYCGPASLAMLVSWLGMPVTQEDMAALVYTPERKGTLQTDMVTAARRLGFLAVEANDPQMAFSQVAEGRPVVIFQNLGLGIAPKWHYAVLVGYNLENKTVTLHSGLNENEVMEMETFLRTWKRTDYWHLVLSPLGEIPASVKPLEVQKAILGLEQISMGDMAKTAYETALQRWPTHFGLRMGLANLLYTEKDYKGAEQQFLQVWKDHPKAHAPLNNLTYTLIAQQCYTNAIHAAREALWLAPEAEKEAVQQTLDEALLHHGKREARNCMRQPVIR